MSSVYLIYADADRAYADALKALLLSSGDTIQTSDLSDPATPSDASTRHTNMLSSNNVIIVYSPAALASPVISDDIAFALSGQALTLSVLIAMVAPIDVPHAAITYTMLRFIDRPPAGVAQGIASLLHPRLNDSPSWLEEERARSPIVDIIVVEPDAFGGDENLPAESGDFFAPSAGPSGGSEIDWLELEREQAEPIPAQEAPAPPAPKPDGAPPRSVQPAPSAPPPILGGLPPVPAPSAPVAQPSGEVTSKPSRRDREDPPTTTAVDTLQFSAYHPNAVPTETWNTLLVYTYLAAALAKVQADAATFSELGSNPSVATGTATRAVTQGVEISIEPHMEGVTFSPAQDTFIWRGDWHRSLFRFSGNSGLSEQSQTGWIDIYADGLVPIARIDLNVPFHSQAIEQTLPTFHGVAVTTNIHDRVFISYNHRDREAFEQACELYQRFGITVFSDEQLSAGDNYDQVLSQMIDAANVFHLLWSPRSAASTECRKEWEQALRREPSERFIKPWYWKQPLVTPLDEFSQHHISFRYQHLRRKWWKPETW